MVKTIVNCMVSTIVRISSFSVKQPDGAAADSATQHPALCASRLHNKGKVPQGQSRAHTRPPTSVPNADVLQHTTSIACALGITAAHHGITRSTGFWFLFCFAFVCVVPVAYDKR